MKLQSVAALKASPNFGCSRTNSFKLPELPKPFKPVMYEPNGAKHKPGFNQLA